MTQPTMHAAEKIAAGTPVRWSVASRHGSSCPGRYSHPGLRKAMARGSTGHCPACGVGLLFATWLRQNAVCTACPAPLGAVRADDAPPYFVIFFVAHFVIALQVLSDAWLNLSIIEEAIVFLPLTLLLSLGLLRPVKGATIGLMLQLDMVEKAEPLS